MNVMQIVPLQIIIPLLAAPALALFNHPRIAWGLATLVTWSTFAVSIVLFHAVQTNGVPISYAMGGWVAPIGIEVRITLFNALILALISGVASLDPRRTDFCAPVLGMLERPPTE